MPAMLPPLLLILTGVGFLLVMAVALLARPAIRDWSGRLIAFGMLCIPAGLYFLSDAAGRGSSSSSMYIAAAVAFTLSPVLSAAGLFIRGRQMAGVR
jgi:hypothetical protein